MGAVHQLLEEHGRQHDLQFDLDRRVIDAACDYLADEDNSVGFLFSGWAQAALPHRRLADDAPWQVRTDRCTLLVEPGRKTLPAGPPVFVGVPYGSRARLIMLYLQSQAIKTGSREVELGRSLRDWLGRMGISVGGKSATAVREQAERITRCRLSFSLQLDGKEGLIQQHIVDTALFLDADHQQRSSGFVDVVKLGEGFYEQLKRHPVPLEEAAVRAISGHSMALDIYAWLAYRLHALTGDRPITWKALHAQFGAGIARLDHFRPVFLENMELATAVYPGAKVMADGKGLVLSPSRSPVSPRLVAVSSR